MKVLANGKEMTLPKMTSEQLNEIFGVGNWEIVETASIVSLTSDDKARKLGLNPASETWRDLKELIKRAQDSIKEIQEYLKKSGIKVQCSLYIGNLNGNPKQSEE